MARVTAVIYAIAAVFAVGLTALESFQRYEQALHSYEVEVAPSKQVVVVKAQNEAELAEIMRSYCKGPRCTKPPSVIPIRRDWQVEGALKDAGAMALGWGLAYLALWAAFRAIKWIALGFMDARNTA